MGASEANDDGTAWIIRTDLTWMDEEWKNSGTVMMVKELHRKLEIIKEGSENY